LGFFYVCNLTPEASLSAGFVVFGLGTKPPIKRFGSHAPRYKEYFMDEATKTVDQLDAEADELLSMMMNGESPEAQTDVGADNPDQVEQTTEATQADSQFSQEIAPAQEEAKNELETLNKRLADSRRKITELGQENATLRNQLAEVNKQLADYREKEFSAQSNERAQSIEALSGEYEFLKPMMAELNELRQQVRQQAQQVTQTKIEQDQQAAQQAHMNAILSVHPDALSVAQSGSFQSWLSNQHPRLQQVLDNGTASEVVELMSAYKAQSSQQPQQSKLDKAREIATPNTRSQASPNAKRTYTEAEINAMPMSEFLKHEADIDAAYAEGRVI
jgi:chromosome segregation ATPase